MLHVWALAGVFGLSFSAVLVRLASVSPVTATFYRGLYALPLLAVLWLRAGAADRRPARDRVLAGGSGVLLAVDLALWHESIALIGVGLATVIASVQVVFVAALAWALHGERPSAGLTATASALLAGLALTSGLARPDAYGAAPVAGTLYGIGAGASYAAFLVAFRAANRTLAPTAGPLLDATLGLTAGALLVAPIDARFALAPSLPAHAWLLLLAIGSQVAAWMLIATALPRLPALEISVLLLVQPVLALMWGALLFDERLSTPQWLGALLVLGGVGMASWRGARWRAARVGAPAVLLD